MRSTKMAKVLSLILAVTLVAALSVTTTFAATVEIGDAGVTYSNGVMTVPVNIAANTGDQITILASDTETYNENTTKIMYINQYDQSEITNGQIQFKINSAVADTIYIKVSATGMNAPDTATYEASKLPGMLANAAAELAADVKGLTSADAYTAAITELQAIVDYGTANPDKVDELDAANAAQYADVADKIADYTSANAFRNALIAAFGMDASTTLTAAQTGFVGDGSLVGVDYESADAADATVTVAQNLTVANVEDLEISAVYGDNVAVTFGNDITVARPAEGEDNADFTVTYTIVSGDYTATATVTKAITAVGATGSSGSSDVIDETVDADNVTTAVVADSTNFGGFDKYVEIEVGEDAIDIDVATQTIVALAADGETEVGELYYSAERGVFVGAFKSADVGTTYKIVDKDGGAETIMCGNANNDDTVSIFDAIAVAQNYVI